jgi:hypothetical protein
MFQRSIVGNGALISGMGSRVLPGTRRGTGWIGRGYGSSSRHIRTTPRRENDKDIHQLQILVMKGSSMTEGKKVPKSAQSSRISKVLLPPSARCGSSISDCRDNGAV